MIRIQTSVRGRRVMFAVIGRIESNDLLELKRLIVDAPYPFPPTAPLATAPLRQAIIGKRADWPTGGIGACVGSVVVRSARSGPKRVAGGDGGR
jgi:hypothetical protein